MERVPDVIVVGTGVVLSGKPPKVPRPAPPTAAPMTPSEPTTLRVVALFVVLVLMAVYSLYRFVDRPFPVTGRTLEGEPQATRQRSARNPQDAGRPLTAVTYRDKCPWGGQMGS